jgi:hypothetical protein
LEKQCIIKESGESKADSSKSINKPIEVLNPRSERTFSFGFDKGDIEKS